MLSLGSTGESVEPVRSQSTTCEMMATWTRVRTSARHLPTRLCWITPWVPSQQIAFYAVRHCVKPGVTGWAQVRYQYGASVDDAAEKLQYDLYYVKNHSLILDTLVLFETVRVVLTGEGAH